MPNFEWRQPALAFKQLPQSAIITDCKSLYDLITRIAMPSCEEYRTTLEVLLIKDRCMEHCVVGFLRDCSWQMFLLRPWIQVSSVRLSVRDVSVSLTKPSAWNGTPIEKPPRHGAVHIQKEKWTSVKCPQKWAIALDVNPPDVPIAAVQLSRRVGSGH